MDWTPTDTPIKRISRDNLVWDRYIESYENLRTAREVYIEAEKRYEAAKAKVQALKGGTLPCESK